MACYIFEFTFFCNDILGPSDYEVIKGLLAPNIKKGTFQLERGSESDKLHYQGIFSLRNKKSAIGLGKMFQSTDLRGISFRPVSNETRELFEAGIDNYWNKKATAEAGPWDLKDVPAPLTTQLKIFNTFDLYPWQAQMKEIISEFTMRDINLVYDMNGNMGKSLFLEYLEYHKLAEEVPPFRLMDDIFQWVYSCPGKPCYVFDMPRGMKKDKLGDFYSGIEVIKNGVAYDKRYTAKKIRFNRPNIFVFTNTLPEWSLMSKDRWKVWTISKKLELVQMESLDL